jgi:hypothetical protein
MPAISFCPSVDAYIEKEYRMKRGHSRRSGPFFLTSSHPRKRLPVMPIDGIRGVKPISGFPEHISSSHISKKPIKWRERENGR